MYNHEYFADLTDPIDVALAAHIRAKGTPVPFKRIRKGEYMYGEIPIFMMYNHFHLYVRLSKLGKDYDLIEDFVANYERV